MNKKADDCEIVKPNTPWEVLLESIYQNLLIEYEYELYMSTPREKEDKSPEDRPVWVK